MHNAIIRTHKSLSAATISLSTLVCAACLAGCGEKKEFRDADGVVWSTTYHVVYQSERDLSDSITAELARIGSSLSVFEKGSLVDRVNRSAGGIEVDSLFRKVYGQSKTIHALSGGMFDPTISPLITAWGFGKGHTPTADTIRIDSLLAMTGIDRTRIEGSRLYKDDPRIQFNFSAVAKGYGADCVGYMLERNGVSNYLVEIGGEIKARGRNRQGNPWTVAIDSPEEDGNLNHTAVTIVEIVDEGIATSGNYRNYHESKGGRYGHTISPLTGRPVRTDVISATVLAPTAMEADAAATACMAIGSEAALKLCDSLDYRVLLILDDETALYNHLFTGVANTAAKIAGREAGGANR